MATLKVDISGRGGLANRHWGDLDKAAGYQNPELRYIAGNGQMVDGYYNPFRRYGYLSAANTNFVTIDQPTSFTGLPNCVVYDDVNADTIWGSNGRYFMSLSDGLDDTQFYKGSTYGDYGTTGTPTLKDLDIYQINGVRKLFTVYEKSDNIEIGHYPLAYDSGAGTDTFFSTQGGGTISFQRTAFMRVADNGFAYLFLDNTVHKIDGTSATGGSNGTVTPNVLVFPATFTIADAIDFKGAFFIGIIQAAITPSSASSAQSVYAVPCGVYVWNRQSTSVSTVDYLPIYGIRSINRLYVTHEGRLRAMVTNAEGVVEIREYNGATFVPIVEVGRNAFPNVHDSLTSQGGVVIWLGNNGDIYAHGKLAPGEPDALFKIGKLTNTATATGAIFFGGGNSYSSTTGFKSFRSGLDIGYTDNGGSHVVKQWDMYGTGAASNTSTDNKLLQGDVFSPVILLPEMSVLKNIWVQMARGSGSGSTTSGTLKVYLNQSATAWAAKTVTRDEQARGYKHIEVNVPYVNAVQVEIEWPTDTGTSGNFDIAPSYMTIDFEQPGEKG